MGPLSRGYGIYQVMLLLAWENQEAWNQQMTPKLMNKAFSEKSTQFMCLECHKEPYETTLRTRERGTLCSG